jgi:HAD superfamily hydrolase (TIGR01549 family)
MGLIMQKMKRVTCPEELDAEIAEYGPTVLSVDLFDTLVYRRCPEPCTVFEIQFERIKSIIPAQSCESWRNLRSTTESRLSKRALPSEILIDHIYREIGAKTNSDWDAMCSCLDAELSVEQEVIRPYEKVVEVLKKWNSLGIEICITTDTYLPVNFIKSLLAGILTFPFMLLCSSETMCPKRSGLAYGQLLSMYPASRILHIGDNLVSDIKRAEEAGISTCLIDWGRRAFLKRNGLIIEYLKQMNIRAFNTPIELFPSTAIEGARHEVAWRWAAVLTDFLQSVEVAAHCYNADEVWFLSRDCETMYKVVKTDPRGLAPFLLKYVYASRAAVHPIVALRDPLLFETWAKKGVDEEVLDKARGASEAYTRLADDGSQRIMIVDNGWKGRLQVALQMALIKKDVRGFYFSLEDTAETESITNSDLFIGWDPSMINQSAAESLAGYSGPGCTGYQPESGDRWVPTFRTNERDVSPRDYCDALFTYLYEFWESSALSTRASLELRKSVIRELMAFPDYIVAMAFEGWGMYTSVDGIGEVAFQGGERLCTISKIIGRHVGGNLWPQLALWGVLSNRKLVRLLQATIYARRALKRN